MIPTIHDGTFESALVPNAVGYSVITPPGWKQEETLPLILVLHGANSSSAIIKIQVGMLQEMWESQTLPPVLVACASTPTINGFYIDQEAGKWESVLTEDFLPHLESQFNADLSRIGLMGSSMGGYGALKTAFKTPERFTAVAAVEPTIFPTETPANIRPRNIIGNAKPLFDSMVENGYADNHVVTRLRANAGAIKTSALPIFIECGDDDCFKLQDGVEYLHRVLWDLDISHDYHLIKDADHIGPEVPTRIKAALAFVGKHLEPKLDAAIPAEIQTWLGKGCPSPPPPLDFSAPYAPKVMRLMIKSQTEAALQADPTTAQRFGPLPTNVQ